MFFSFEIYDITSLVFLLVLLSVLLHFLFFCLHINVGSFQGSCPSHLSFDYTLFLINHTHSHVFIYHLLASTGLCSQVYVTVSSTSISGALCWNVQEHISMGMPHRPLSQSALTYKRAESLCRQGKS